MEYYFDYFLKQNNVRKLSFPLTMQFEFMEQCNLKCPYCYNNSSTNPIEKNFEMNKWTKLFYEIRKSGGIFQCILSGGEPLIYYNQIFELIKGLHEACTGFVMTTNGTLLNEKIVKRMNAYRWFWIQVSLDSYIAEKHDRIRGMTGAFNKITNGIELLVNNNLPVTISTVITPENLNDIEGIIAYAIKHQVNSLLLSPVLPVGRAQSNNDLILDKNQLKFFKNKVKYYSEKYTKIHIKLAADYSDYIVGQKKYKSTGLIVRPNGDVKIDCLSDEIIGNAFSENIKEIWADYLRKEDMEP